MSYNTEDQSNETSATEDKSLLFADWFVLRLKGSKKLQAHHFNSILAFFKNQGLSERESAENFDAALKIFGF